jgi:NADP-reducing hydrogenase subunit HndB
VAKLTPEDLGAIRDQMAKSMSLRDGDIRARINVHMGTCGIAAGARKIVSAVMALIDAGEGKDVALTTSGCAGLCSREPMMTVEIRDEAPVKYVDLTEEKVKKIYEDHVLGGTVVAEYALAVGSERVG